MKKFLKSRPFEAKIDYEEIRNPSPPNVVQTPQPAAIEENETMKPVVQPPLPPVPPPPDSPPKLNVTIKKELEDTEHQSSTEEDSNQSAQQNLITEFKTDETEKQEKQKITVCRDYIRGTCTRPGCKYAHEYDVSQLVGVYVFCRNYQNSLCTYPNCKYVHATVFEEQRFYRTGILPPHALSHHKKVNVLQPPPPPPPPPSNETQPELVVDFTNPPPTLPTQLNSTTLPTGYELPNASLPVGPIDEIRSKATASTSPVIREWNDDFNKSPYENKSVEPIAKKCKHCDITELRLEFHKNEMETLMRSSEDLNKKISDLSKKRHRLVALLRTLLKINPTGITHSVLNGLTSSQNDKELLGENRTRSHMTKLIAQLLIQYSLKEELSLDATRHITK